MEEILGRTVAAVLTAAIVVATVILARWWDRRKNK